MWFEATLIGILCYLGALSSPWLLGLTGGWYILSRPLVSGMLVGGYPRRCADRHYHRCCGSGGVYRHGNTGRIDAGRSQFCGVPGDCVGHSFR
ncbi:Uncharacterised protein [Serratia quinivorans]|uniref:Uncharacterized protein n=1 Tax=Serratia quinivorans TaxID=137545 RepID=A0A379ZU50_9GAMM|nr:Uncharacterised protein [Serratia quinivorans]